MTPHDRIANYFAMCGEGSAAEIAAHFTSDAVIFDTNIRPIRGATEIGDMWVNVRDRWGGARWSVDSCVGDWSGAAIEWSMTGVDPKTNQDFTFRGSEHYRFVDSLIDEIRQYWTFNRSELTTGLIGYRYHESAG